MINKDNKSCLFTSNLIRVLFISCTLLNNCKI